LKCNSVDGVLCAHCGKKNHFSQRHKKSGGVYVPYWSGDRHDACWRRLARARVRFKRCEAHADPLAECDLCHTRTPAVMPKETWIHWPRDPEGWEQLKGLHGDKALLLCPSCQGSFRVGLDWSLERGGEPLLSESIACAFAFQIGQASGWHTKAEHFEVMSWQLDPKWLGTDLNRWDVGQP
jgi:hypothetical protein